MARRKRVEPTEEWAALELLLEWPEQVEYERIRPPVLFGSPVAERARQTGTPQTTLRRRIESFEHEGMRGLFGSEASAGKSTPAPEVRRLMLDLKTEHPPMRDNEIATVCYVRFGRRPHGRTVRKALETGPTAIRMFRRFPPYHEIEGVVERRLAIVTLHAEGWNTKSIAGYLKTSRPTVYRALKKWIAEGVHGLDDRPRGGRRKADLRAMNEVRKLQENPELGEFRVSAALERLGIFLSPRTCGRYTWLSHHWREITIRGILLNLGKIVAALAQGRTRWVADLRNRCPSHPTGITSFGPRTCATWTCWTRACSPGT